MQTREDYEKLELQILAPYACRAAESKQREFKESEHAYRSCFQRDRDRIVHSKAFRRLEYKTQVFVNHEGDHYRTRLTHSLEAAQISRSIARMLRLNEDLVEAIALAHDLGHPPFGHSGEAVIHEKMETHGGFEHNRQSMRIVMLLEKTYPKFPGLNLSFEVLEGMAKHFREYSPEPGRLFKREGSPSLEAQIVNLADEIAYNNHDLDDGLRSQMLTLESLEQVELWQEAYEETNRQAPELPETLKIRTTVKTLINRLVMDLVLHTHSAIEAFKIKNLEDIRNQPQPIAGFSSSIRKKVIELKKFLFNRLYRQYRVERMADKANRILKKLFEAYTQNPRILPTDIYQKCDQEPLARVVCDYIAGMTDRFALEEYQKLFDPHAKV